MLRIIPRPKCDLVTRPVRSKGAKLVGEPLGQHRNHAPGKIDGGGAETGFGIERAAFFHIMRDVGDVDPETVSVIRAVDLDGVVEIPGGLTVDRDDRVLPVVRPRREIFGRRDVGH